jgi:hypothetical protein
MLNYGSRYNRLYGGGSYNCFIHSQHNVTTTFRTKNYYAGKTMNLTMDLLVLVCLPLYNDSVKHQLKEDIMMRYLMSSFHSSGSMPTPLFENGVHNINIFINGNVPKTTLPSRKIFSILIFRNPLRMDPEYWSNG